MTYRFSHRINTRHPYTSAADTDIRKTFERIRNAANQTNTVLDADPVPAGTQKWEKPDKCGW